MADDTLGSRVRTQRSRKGWTLDQLAQESGLSKGFISTVENDHSQPSGRALLRLAQALGASVDYLLQGSGEEPAPPGDSGTGVAIPRELAVVAEAGGWSFSKVRAVLEARQAIIARRSDQAQRPFTSAQWRDFAERLGPYLDREDS